MELALVLLCKPSTSPSPSSNSASQTFVRFYGENAERAAGSFRLKEAWPIEEGRCVNWDSMESLWEHLFISELKIPTEGTTNPAARYSISNPLISQISRVSVHGYCEAIHKQGQQRKEFASLHGDM